MAQKIFYADDFTPNFGLPWTPPPTDDELAAMTDEQLRGVIQARQMIEKGQNENPVGWGWTLPSWQLVMECYRKYNVIILLGGNQAGKSLIGARMSVWAANEIPGAEVYNFHISERRSIDDQQRFVYEALPERLKNLPTKKGVAFSLQFTQKNGFTDGIAIMPPVAGHKRGGSIKFYNFSQFSQNPQIIEGIKAHFVWADERIPLDLFETIRMGRLMTHRGRLLVTYTCVDGWNETIEKILSKTRTLKSVFCNHPKVMQHVPILQESLSIGSCCIIYAHTQDNPFTSIEEFWKINANETKETILARGFGVPTKSLVGAFPLFSKEYTSEGGNVVKHDELPWLKKRYNAKGAEIPYPITRYMAVDPAGSKSWFAVWVAIDPSGTWWVYREFPDSEDWAMPGDKNGPATKPSVHGIRAYVDLFKSLEGDEQIYERVIDPRMGAAERQSADGATTIISELDELGMIFIPAPAAAGEGNVGEIEDGLQLINDLLAYKTDIPQDAINRPKLYVSDRCPNLIYSLQEYTAKLGTKEATKDPIDVVRYLRKANCAYVPPQTREDSGSAGVY